MSTERLIQAIGKLSNRRTFLRRVGIASLASIIGVLGLPSSAQAFDVACCHLCWDPGQPCPSDTSCSWCGTCCDGIFGNLFQCCEGYGPGGACSGGCFSAVCSWYNYLGTCFRPSAA